MVGKSSRQLVVIKSVTVGNYRSQIDVWKVQGNERNIKEMLLIEELGIN